MVEAAKITLQDFEEAKAQILQLFNADEPLLAMDTLEKLCKLALCSFTLNPFPLLTQLNVV